MENARPTPLCTFLPLLPKGRIDNVLYRAQIALRADTISEEELHKNLASLSGKNQAIVFPSHFFEFGSYNICLNWLKELSVPFWIQISPGAELRDYLSHIENIKQNLNSCFRGIEVVMDRAPHATDWHTFSHLKNLNIQQRFVFCPVVELNALNAISMMPKEIYEDLFLYFPQKKSNKDSFYSADEIFIFLEKIKERIPNYKAQVLTHLSLAETLNAIKESEWEKNFRSDLNSQAYLDNFPLSGKGKVFRSILIRLVKNIITAPIVLGPYLIIWLFHDPRTLLLTPKKYLVYPALAIKRINVLIDLAIKRLTVIIEIITKRFTVFLDSIYKRFQSLQESFKFTFKRLCTIGWHIIFSFRHIGYIFWMIFCYARTFVMKFYYGFMHLLNYLVLILRILFSAILHPAIYSKHYFPPLYWIIFFPVLKIYWIAEYQFKKRILKIPAKES